MKVIRATIVAGLLAVTLVAPASAQSDCFLLCPSASERARETQRQSDRLDALEQRQRVIERERERQESQQRFDDFLRPSSTRCTGLFC